MTTYTLGLPAYLRHKLQDTLPRQSGQKPGVQVTSRDRDEGRCAAYEADHYEVMAYHITYVPASLDQLEEALRAVPGVYMTTQVHPDQAGATFTNPDWPPRLGSDRRDRRRLRAMVIALMHDTDATRAERHASHPVQSSPSTKVPGTDPLVRALSRVASVAQDASRAATSGQATTSYVRRLLQSALDNLADVERREGIEVATLMVPCGQ